MSTGSLRRDTRRAARRTAAHSTAVLNEESSSRFSSREADARIVSGPRTVTASKP